MDALAPAIQNLASDWGPARKYAALDQYIYPVTYESAEYLTTYPYKFDRRSHHKIFLLGVCLLDKAHNFLFDLCVESLPTDSYLEITLFTLASSMGYGI